MGFFFHTLSLSLFHSLVSPLFDTDSHRSARALHKVVSLLNDAMLASSTEDRITCLKQVSVGLLPLTPLAPLLVLTRTFPSIPEPKIEELIVRKAPELLDNFFEEILQFQTDQSGEVRRELIAFLETTTYVSLTHTHTHKHTPVPFSLFFVSFRALFYVSGKKCKTET